MVTVISNKGAAVVITYLRSCPDTFFIVAVNIIDDPTLIVVFGILISTEIEDASVVVDCAVANVHNIIAKPKRDL